VADEAASQRHLIGLGRELACSNPEHGRGDLTEKGRNDRRGADALDQNRAHVLTDLQQFGFVFLVGRGQHAGQSFEERAGENAGEGVRLRAE
jgi:hypothetical protein